jgi:diguanylate cyclase (GGDEF)-like protein/PAS domain S-box-containing protein
MDLGKNNDPYRYRSDLIDPLPDQLHHDLFLTKALAGAGVGTWKHDLLTGIISWDAVTSQIFGRGPMPGQGDGFRIHGGDLERVRLAVDRCINENEPFDIECRAIRDDGVVRWVHAKATASSYHELPKCFLAGIVSDITDRKVAEERLREAEERYRLISRATMDFVYEWDFKANHLSWNDAFNHCFGHAGDQLGDIRSFYQKIHPDDVDNVLRQMRGLLDSTQEQIALEYRIRKPDGSYAYVYACSYIIRDRMGRPSKLIGSLLDLTERKLAELAFEQSEALNRSIVEAVTECVMVIGLDGTMQFINAPGARAVGIDDPSVFYGLDWISFWPKSKQDVVKAALSQALDGGTGAFSEATKTVAGIEKTWDVVISLVLSNGMTTKLVAIARDVSERRQAQAALVRAASEDALTGLMNRATFQELLSRQVSSARFHSSNFGILLLDLDNFKQVNDNEGHDVGDHLLASIAQRMRDIAPARAAVSRLGGDEFAILIDDISTIADLDVLARRLLEHIRVPLTFGERSLDCSVTIGAAAFPEHGCNPDELLKSADIALYVAKNQKRGSAVLFEPGHRAEIQARQSMLKRGRAALREARIAPYYQPKVRLSNRGVFGFEALLRWSDDGGRIHLPSTIAAAFEDLDLAAAISDCMIGRVIEDMQRWQAEGVQFGHVAVNATAAEFRRDDFAEALLERLERARVPKACFQLEVTETVFLGRGSEYVHRALKLLNREGVSIALDDFGTGYASLRHLKDFPVDVIKIDQSFVRDMEASSSDAAIVGAVLNLGCSLGIEVIAEGIETAEQHERLREMGCHYGQGFLYSRAVPATNIPKLCNMI